MLGHLQSSAHLPKRELNKISESKGLGLSLSLTCYKCFLDIGTMTIESVPHPLDSLKSCGKKRKSFSLEYFNLGPYLGIYIGVVSVEHF